MILFAYPGTGKTTLSKGDYRFIDLDSSDPLIRDWRTPKFLKKAWEETYCNMALMLSRQGYYVMVSTHPEVIRRIMARATNVGVIFPDSFLEKQWVERLCERYHDCRSRSTHNAWLRAKEHFQEDISVLSKLKCPQLVIKDMGYNLKRGIIETFGEEKSGQ